MKWNYTAISVFLFSFTITFWFMDHSLRNEKNLSSIHGIPPNDWFEKQRAYPFNEIPEEEHLKAIEYVKKNIQEHSSYKPLQLSWQLAGPINIEGRVTSVAIHPTIPSVVYVGTANGGLWKSINFCQSYIPIFDNQNTLSIGDVAIDPVNPNNIYCATGEANSLRSYYPGTGIYKSTDAGVTWLLKGLPSSYSIGRIAINPANPQEIYAAALGSLRKKNDERGLYKSTNGGDSWTRVLYIADSVSVVDVVIDPNNPSKVFAASWERLRREDYIKYGGPKTALYLSTDAGSTWSIVQGGFPSGQSDLGRISIDISKSNSNIIYALTSYANGNSRGLYKSTNGGTNWSLINSSAGYSSNYAWFNRICKVNPSNPNDVYCGGLDMEHSTNGGSSFTYSFESHVDQHAVAFAPSNNNYVVLGHDGGIDYSTNGGVSGIESMTLPISQFYSGDINTANNNDILGGTQDNSTIRSVTGSVNNWTTILGGDGLMCKIDHQNQQRVYASYQNGGLQRSTNGGNSFMTGTSGLDLTYTNWMTPFVLDKNNPLTIYAGTFKIHKSINGMQSWAPISPDLASGHSVNLGTITTVDVAKSNPSVIYCGTDDANVWVTTNGGTNWNSIKSGLPTRWVTRVATNPDSANICYVTLSGYKLDAPGAHIYRTTNYGQTWISINGNLPDAPVNDIIIDPMDHNLLYTATDNGVFFTDNLGVNWYTLAQGLTPTAPCHDLTLHEASRKLVVWTHGRSAYSLILPNPPLPVELTNFTATSDGGEVTLNWITASEKNNRGFELQKSNDGKSFYAAAFISGKGTTTQKNNYSYTDKNALQGTSYRLAQFDYDGRVTYSKVIKTEGAGIRNYSLNQNYPNPFNPSTKITYTLPYVSTVKLLLYNSVGQKVKELVSSVQQPGTHEYTLGANDLSSGVYLYSLTAFSNDNKIHFTQTKKLIIIR